NSRRRKPLVEELLHPLGNGNSSNVATLSDEIHDRPPILAPLKMIETEIGQFASPKTATQQDGNDRSVALALEGFGIRGLPQVPSFFCGQPISQPNAKSLDAFYAPDVGCQLWAQ